MPQLLLLLLLGLLAPASLRAQSSCDAPILLKSQSSQGQILLSWKPAWHQSAWQVEAASRADFADSVVLGSTLVPDWSWQLQPGQASRFFRVKAVDGPVLPWETPLEDFERMPLLESWPGEDAQPEAWEQDGTQFAGGGASLHLFGNTVKAQPLGGPRLLADETWSLMARVDGVADRQMVGFADSVNVLWYVLWGSRGGYGDTPGQSGQTEVSCYQGWFPEGQWVEALLPVGRDWTGKYGYLPRLCQVLWANDCDSDAGEFWVDELRRVDAQAGAPVADARHEVLGQQGDSLLVHLWNPAAQAGQTQTWHVGDGRRLRGDDLELRLAASRDHRVALVSEDESGGWDLASFVVDGGNAPRLVRLSFGGDVMTARKYEDPGGIIETQGVDAIFDSLRAALQEPDLALVNLECAYTVADTRHPTKSIAFKSRPENLLGVVNAGVDGVSLANNHSFDFMEAGLQETLGGLDSLDLPYTGAGFTSTAAARPMLLSAQGLGVGVAAFCDRTGNYNNAQPYLDAGLSRPGFRLWSRADMQALLPDLAQHSDVTVALVHSGNEYSAQPTTLSTGQGAALQAEEGLGVNPDEKPLLARELLPDQSERSLRQEAVDLGARLVITHHPHIVQGFEVWHGGLIAHSLGNLVMELDYQETMPSVLLEVEDDGQALRSAELQPVYIENYKPRLCRGETAALLLDHITRISRPFNTWVLRQPGAEKGWIALDTTALQFTTTTGTLTVPFELRNGWYESPPLRVNGEGELAALRQTAAVAGTELRLGRDQCWWGNMEDEGAQVWDMNSAQESFATDQVLRGARSLRQQESGTTVYTYYTVRAPLDLASSWTALAWVRTQNATGATVQMRYYDTRSSDLLSTATVGSVVGTAAWTRVWQDLAVPDGADFYQYRLGLNAPAAGGTAWFDDVSLVEWDAWQALATTNPLPVAIPNDLQWVQLRRPAAGGDATLEWTRQLCEPMD